MATWLEEIINAFKALGGRASYDDLFDYIEKHTTKNLYATWRNTVRTEIIRHSSDSTSYTGGDDLFYRVGPGIWGLRGYKENQENKMDTYNDSYPKYIKGEGLVIKIAWNGRYWKEYDPEMVSKVYFNFVKDTGIAHEWWSFNNDLDEKYYLSTIPGSRRPIEDFEGVIFFISLSPHDNKFYLIGVYGVGKVFSSSDKVDKRIDLRKYLDKMRKLFPEKYSVLKEEDYLWKPIVWGVKEKSFLLKKYIEIEPSYIGVKKFGSWNFTYIDATKVCNLFKKIESCQSCIDPSNLSVIYELFDIYNCELSSPEEKEPPLFKILDNIINPKNQLILYGPPGTGKTWVARNYALNGVGENNDRVAFVTFHPSFSYEDFVESIKPNADEDELRFRIEEGIFKRIARNAYNALLEYAGVHVSKRWDANGELPDLEDEERNKVKDVLDKEDFPKFYIIIDEINRGDVSKIFGELITLLEKDKRLFMENEMIVRLPYSKKKFGVPPNLYIIGTMNTADRSIALMDVALRRRFAFLEIMPSYTVLLTHLGISTVNKEDDAVKEIKGWKGDDLRDIKKLAIKALYTINEEIKKNYDRDHQIGHSYYLQLKDAKTEDELKSKLKYMWLYEILPLLQEYFYGSNENLEKILYPCNKSGNVENDVIGCYKRDIIKEDESWSIAKFFDAIINHKKPSEKNE